MGRDYVELECGCLVSCDGGGGLIPYGCDQDEDCKFDEWSTQHPLCRWCGYCLACNPSAHDSCQTNIGNYVERLEGVVDTVRAVVAEPSLLWPYEEDGRALALVDALEALDKEEEDSDE